MKPFLKTLELLAVTGTLMTSTPAAPAAEPAAAFQKPAWLTDCSFSLKESYDDNVFASDVNRQLIPGSYTPPAGGVVAWPGVGSWVTTASPKLGVNLAPVLGDGKTLSTLSLTYAPDFATYHDQSSESCATHRWLTTVKAASEEVSLSADNTLTFIDGSEFSPLYPGQYFYNAFVTSAVRERREQLQDKAAVSAQFSQEHWFARATASLLYYDLMTQRLNLAGYQNYCDRADVNGGLDLGWKLAPSFALTLGYRYGHQYQERYAFSTYSTCSDYQRLLAGFEGKPLKWLEVKVQAGPDFRSYPGNTAATVTPINDHSPVKFYGEQSLTATLSGSDTLALKSKQWQWVSSLGKTPTYDASGELNYHHQFCKPLGLDLGGRVASWDYNGGNLPTCRRHDLLYTVTTGLTYAFNPHVNVSASWAMDLGRNGEDNVDNPDTREFQHQIVSLATQIKF